MKKATLLILLISITSTANAQLLGTLNNAFSQNGWDASVFGNNNGFTVTKTIIQPDDKVLVCAEANFSDEGHQAVIVRYNPDGTVDTNFGGGDGMVRSKNDVAISLYTRAYGMALQSNGKIIVAGDQFYNTERIFRLNADGTYDTTFGTDGVIDISRPNSEFIYQVAVQSDNKIIVCGKESRFVAGVLEPHVFLWRFTENGSLDNSFGNSGIVSYRSTAWLGTIETYMVINDLIVLPDDKILINQSFTKFPNSSVMLRKFNADGTSDNSFGTNGEAIKTEISNDGNYYYSSSSVQQNGSIITSFTSRDEIDSNYKQIIYRINAQGQTDASFNIDMGNPTSFPEVMSIIVSGERCYVFKKTSQDDLSFDQIHCYDLNGDTITEFGDNGIAVINQNDIPVAGSVKAAVSENGNIYLATSISDPINSDDSLFLISNVIGFDSNLSQTDFMSTTAVSIYPNPFYNQITVLFNRIDEPTTVSILDMNGRVLAKSICTELDTVINLGTLNSGLYLVQFQNSKESFIQKIIKQ